MEIFIFPRVFNILLLCSWIVSVHGTTIQFFKKADFKGDQLEVNSSTNCINAPTEIYNFKGSVRTSACVVFYSKKDCSDLTSYSGSHIYGYVHLVKSEENNMQGLNFTYHSQSSKIFNVISFRDCTEMEAREQADFDYYEKYEYSGEVTRSRDICECTTLPTNLYSTSFHRSLNTYGNCFQFYQSTTCSGTPWDKTFAIKYTHFYTDMRSIKPCYLPESCKRYKATILNFEPTSSITMFQDQNSGNQIFINNNSMTVQHNYSIELETNELVQLQVPNMLKHLNSLNLTQLYPVIIKTSASLLENSSSTFQAAILTALGNLQSNGSQLIHSKINTNQKFHVEGQTVSSPCTTSEIRVFVEVSEIEISLRLQLEIVGNIRNSDERLSTEDIRKRFENFGNLNVTDNGTVIAETTLKIKLRFGIKSWANITQTPIIKCRRWLITLEATVINLTPSNINQSILRQPITTKQIIENNGTSQQVDNYEAEIRINEVAKCQFPAELTKMSSVNFVAGLKPGGEILNPFISKAWKEIKSGLSAAFQNNSSLQEAIMFEVQEEKEYRVQRKITVAPCTKYEINSFIELAEDFEIPYQIQFEVIGRLGDEVVGAEEIQNMLEGTMILRNKDNFTVVAETSGKLTLTYGVASGIEASGSPIPDCRGRFMKFGASIVKLELMTNKSNSTLPPHQFPVAPKQIFINNSTTHQEKSYVAAKDIQETAVFEFPKNVAQLDFIKMEDIIKSKLQNVIPFLPNVWAKLKGGFVPNRSNWDETVSFGVQNEKQFRVQEQLNLAPCMQYDVSSFIEMSNDVEISYRVLLEVTGKLGSEAVTAEEIRGKLKDLTFLHDKDDFTVIAEITMSLRLNYGVGTGVDNAGMQMLDCMEIQAALVANCKFTCSA